MAGNAQEKLINSPVGTVYFTGDAVINGQVDLEKTIRYLRGLERALQYYAAKVDPEIVRANYKIEVRIRPGSLVTDVLAITSGIGLTGVLTVGAGAYLKAVGDQLGKNDIGTKTSRDVAKSALAAMTATMKIAKHRGTMMLGRALKPEETKVVDADNITLTNSKGEKLKVTKAELDLYRETPKNEFKDIMSLVDKNTRLYIGDRPIDPSNITDNAVSIDFIEKRIFDDSDEVVDGSLIFPELMQGDVVVLEGELTRGNGRTNTLGFSYGGRILKCIPYGGDGVKSVRSMLFGYVRLKASVDRRSTAKGSDAVLKKPILRIMEIDKIEEDEEESDQTRLI